MKYKISKSDVGFYPRLIDNNHYMHILDKDIAKYLHLEFEEYINFIIENNGFLYSNYYYFETEKEYQDFIEKVIEPRLVMKELTK